MRHYSGPKPLQATCRVSTIWLRTTEQGFPMNTKMWKMKNLSKHSPYVLTRFCSSGHQHLMLMSWPLKSRQNVSTMFRQIFHLSHLCVHQEALFCGAQPGSAYSEIACGWPNQDDLGKRHGRSTLIGCLIWVTLYLEMYLLEIRLPNGANMNVTLDITRMTSI